MKEEKNTDVFPKHFFWGASTSAHQVEGGNHNQWTVWELENASRLAQTAHMRLNWLPSWDKFKELTTMSKQKISNFAQMYSHLIGNKTMCLSVLKVKESEFKKFKK